MRLPNVEYQNSYITAPVEINQNKIEDTILSKSSLDFSILKRTSSTPQSVVSHKKQRTSPILKSLSNNLIASEARLSCLPSSLKKTVNPNSVSKSVKFLGSRTTRRISENDRYTDKEEVLDNEIANENDNNNTVNVKLFLNDEEEDEDKTKTDQENEMYLFKTNILFLN
jgi:hypothetical protein